MHFLKKEKKNRHSEGIGGQNAGKCGASGSHLFVYSWLISLPCGHGLAVVHVAYFGLWHWTWIAALSCKRGEGPHGTDSRGDTTAS